MSTVIRAKISQKNDYYIPKEKYYELKHFCLQYPEWKKSYAELESSMGPSSWNLQHIRGTGYSDKTAEYGIKLATLSSKIDLVEKCAVLADKELSAYILKAVTEGRSYTYLTMCLNIPASRNLFYDRYRRFFWILSRER